MKHLLLWALLFCYSGHAVAQSDTADDRASCNASFQQDCQSDQTSDPSSDGFAAPLGVLGSSGLEGGLVALLIAGGIAHRLRRQAVGAGRKRNHREAFERPVHVAAAFEIERKRAEP